MPAEDRQIAHLTSVIDFLRTAREAAIRGYEQAIEDLAHEGDFLEKDWSEPYQFLKQRLATMRNAAATPEPK